MDLNTMRLISILFFLSTTSMVKSQICSEGMKLLNYILDNIDTTDFCHYFECIEPLTKEQCPKGTSYYEGVKQFGCCGDCVRFKQEGEGNCTGSIDPNFGGGYGILNNTKDTQGYGWSPNSFLEDERDSNIVLSALCDFYLGCYDGVCKADPKDTLSCRFVRDKFDEAQSWFVDYRDDYRWRPDCTPNGKYQPKQCKGPKDNARCFCVDPYGNTIFGSAFPEETEKYEDMNCACSREVWNRLNSGDMTVSLHCDLNGNYEELQCDEGWCYCIDPIELKPYGAVVPEDILQFLPCYNETLIGEQYLRRCESEYYAHQELYEVMLGHGTLGPTTRLRCDPDGSYSGEQCNYDMCRCYDRYHMESVVSRGGCNCARDRWFFKQYELDIEIDCKAPDNGEAGTYAQIQKPGLYSFCVDADGVRAGPLVCSKYQENLVCENAAECQNGGDFNTTCAMVCKDCPEEAYSQNNGNCVFEED